MLYFIYRLHDNIKRLKIENHLKLPHWISRLFANNRDHKYTCQERREHKRKIIFPMIQIRVKLGQNKLNRIQYEVYRILRLIDFREDIEVVFVFLCLWTKFAEDRIPFQHLCCLFIFKERSRRGGCYWDGANRVEEETIPNDIYGAG